MKVKAGICVECEKVLYDVSNGLFSMAVDYWDMLKNGKVCNDCYDKSKHFTKA